jgi:hypothetical protein
MRKVDWQTVCEHVKLLEKNYTERKKFFDKTDEIIISFRRYEERQQQQLIE